jgi:hypothetical protein
MSKVHVCMLVSVCEQLQIIGRIVAIKKRLEFIKESMQSNAADNNVGFFYLIILYFFTKDTFSFRENTQICEFCVNCSYVGHIDISVGK